MRGQNNNHFKPVKRKTYYLGFDADNRWTQWKTKGKPWNEPENAPEELRASLEADDGMSKVEDFHANRIGGGPAFLGQITVESEYTKQMLRLLRRKGQEQSRPEAA